MYIHSRQTVQTLSFFEARRSTKNISIHNNRHTFCFHFPFFSCCCTQLQTSEGSNILWRTKRHPIQILKECLYDTLSILPYMLPLQTIETRKTRLLLLLIYIAQKSSAMIASSHRAAALFAFGATLLLVSAPDVVQAQKLKQRQQPLLTQEDLCPDYEEIDPLQPCQTVRSFGGLKQLIEAAPSGSSINICPFFVQKVSSVDPIYVRNSIQVTCVRQNPDSICAINGMGHHILIDTAEDTRWQGVSFRGSNDHTVYVTGDVDNAEMATHTFCQSSFINNVRTHDTRGGTFMAEPSSGTINIVQCLFSENYSTTYGAALYSRTNQLNVINSIFVKNVAKGYGGAIFTASGASLMIRGSMFLSNKGRESHDIVYNPSK